MGGSATTTVKVIQHRPTSSQGAGYPIDGTVHSGPIPALLGSCPSVLIQKAQCRELESCASPYAARSYAFRSYHSARRSPPDRCCQSAGRIDALLGGLVLGAQRTGGDAGPQWPVRRAAPCGPAEMQGPPLLLVGVATSLYRLGLPVHIAIFGGRLSSASSRSPSSARNAAAPMQGRLTLSLVGVATSIYRLAPLRLAPLTANCRNRQSYKNT